MPDTIPNLWPDKFKIDVQTPYTILRVQATYLAKVTRGILEAVVETEQSKEKVHHRLVVIAPAFNAYRHTLITANHHPNLPYPVEVRAAGLEESQTRRRQGAGIVPGVLPETYQVTGYPSASNDDQMVQLVEKALRSEETQSVILSLIAKSNESQQVQAPSEQGRPESRQPEDDTDR